MREVPPQSIVRKVLQKEIEDIEGRVIGFKTGSPFLNDFMTPLHETDGRLLTAQKAEDLRRRENWR